MVRGHRRQHSNSTRWKQVGSTRIFQTHMRRPARSRKSVLKRRRAKNTKERQEDTSCGHAKVLTGARARPGHGRLRMESRRAIVSAGRSGPSQHAPRNVGHSLFSGDKTIKPVRPARPCPKAQASPAHQTPTVPGSRCYSSQTPPPRHAKLPSAPPMGEGVVVGTAQVWGCLRRDVPESQGHCEGPCSDHRLPANPSPLLTLPGAHGDPGRGCG